MTLLIRATTGAAVAALMGLTPAHAQCVRDRLFENSIVCEGVDEDGVVAADDTGLIRVLEGALVRSDGTAVVGQVGTSVVVRGTVEGGDGALLLRGRASSTVDTSGRVRARGDAVAFENTEGFRLTFFNSGVVESTDGRGLVDTAPNTQFDSQFVNSGTIRGVTGASVTRGLFDNEGLVEGVGGAGIVFGRHDVGRVTLDNSGEVRGTVGVEARAGSGLEAFIRNDGVIFGTEGTAIDFREGGDAVANEGVIRGDVLFGERSSSLFTRGDSLIEGDVLFGDANDSLTTRSGTFAGDIDLGAGADRLFLDTNDLSFGARFDGQVLLGEGDDHLIVGRGKPAVDFAAAFADVASVFDLGAGEDVIEFAFDADAIAEVVVLDALANAASVRLADESGEGVITFTGAESFLFLDRAFTFAQLAELDAVPLPGAALFALTGLGLGARLRRRG